MKPSRVFIIAEAGVNHNGSLKLAEKLIDAARSSGADAVKFQTFKADRLATCGAPRAPYQVRAVMRKSSQWEMLKVLELSEKDHEILSSYARKKRIEFMSTPFDEESVDLLAQKIGVTRLKIPSGEITHGPLLLKVAKAKLPILLSTGMSTLEEIEDALGVLAFGFLHPARVPAAKSDFQESYVSTEGQKLLIDRITLLHCVSAYPAPYSEMNLRAIDTLRDKFGLPVGLSDHSLGTAIPIAAAGRGACVIEKHFTLSRKLKGPDHTASLEPRELSDMVQAIRQVELALGTGEKKPFASEVINQAVVRRSLVAKVPIQKGDPFTPENLDSKRPAQGLNPMHYWEFLGRRASRNYRKNEMIHHES